MSRTTRFSDQSNLNENETNPNKEQLGSLLLRNNYSRVKPYSKYSDKTDRPSSPNLPYSFLSEELIKRNPKNPDSVFRQTRKEEDIIKDKKNVVERIYNERHTETFNEHLIRGKTSSQPYGFIAKEPHSNYVPDEYRTSSYGAYPPWGIENTGFRTRSHYVAEPAEKFVNIDMYKRPLTNQTGEIIFDHGRPNNGYYLQRHQYENTWFNSNLKLNQNNILKTIAPKTTNEYAAQKDLSQYLVRSRTVCWPSSSEYSEKFA